MTRHDEALAQIKADIRRDAIALAVYKAANEQVIIVLLRAEREHGGVQIAGDHGIPPVTVRLASSIGMCRSVDHVHPRIAFKDAELGEGAGIADAELHRDHVGEGVCDLLVRIAANDTDQIFVTEAVFPYASNDVIVEITPERQIVIKAGGGEMLVANMLRPTFFSRARYMFSTGSFVTVA